MSEQPKNQGTGPKATFFSQTSRAALGLWRSARADARAHNMPASPIGIVSIAIHSALRLQITSMAAALSFRTVFSLIPIMVLGLVLLGATRSEDQVREAVTQVLKFSGLSEIAISPPALDTSPLYAEEPSALPLPVIEAGKSEDSEAPARLDDWIAKLVVGVRNVPFKAIGFVGLLALFYAALSMMVEVETAFNHIYHAPGGRPWKYRLTQYFTTLTLGPLMLFASFWIGSQVQSAVTSGAQSVELLSGMHDTLVFAIGYVSTVSISTVLFLVLFITVPNTIVRPWPAFCGALFSAVLWELGKWGFAHFVVLAGSGGTSSYAKLYGGLALIPLFLLWIYYTWLIVLTGLELSYSMQAFRHAKERGPGFFARLLNPELRDEPAIVDSGLALPMMVVIAERFRDGVPASAAELAREFALTEPVMLEVLQQLASAGLLHRIERQEGGGGLEREFSLSRPPESITAEAILAAGDANSGAAACKHSALVRQFRDLRTHWIHGKALADFMSPRPSPPQSPLPGEPVLNQPSPAA
ncbi:MAG: YhjD/YihY/BrkB family envelope integrity protein [Planctomycetota bacterium]